MKTLCDQCKHFQKTELIGYSYEQIKTYQGHCMKQKSNESDAQKPITSLFWACDKYEKDKTSDINITTDPFQREKEWDAVRGIPFKPFRPERMKEGFRYED